VTHMAALYILLILMILGALIAIEVEDILSSVIAVGAVGLGLSLVCLILRAPDVAITQLVVEIIAVIILIRATVRRNLPGSVTGYRFLSGALAVAFGAVVVVVAMQALRDLPPFGAPEMRVAGHYLANGAAQTGASNLVAAILLDYRAYDTLGEATVLFTAVMGVLAVVRRIGRKPEHDAAGQEDE